MIFQGTSGQYQLFFRTYQDRCRKRVFGVRDCDAFSLIEVTISLGIIAFALVGIMGLFPAALQSARDSQQETQATFIAQQIFGGLSSNLSPSGNFVPTGSDVTDSSHRLAVDLTEEESYYLGFSQEGVALGAVTESEFENAIETREWVYATRVSVFADSPAPGISQVEVLVTSPAVATLPRRSRYPFVTLIRNQ